MKQVLQSLKSGKTEVATVPSPAVQRGQLLISSRLTLVSAGTERMLVEFGRGGWLSKARQQPDKVRMVFDKIKTDGMKPTIEAVLNKLDQPLPLGYCNVGIVQEVGGSVFGFERGDRVASNGKHAGIVSVPINLCAKVPDTVSDEEASFTVLGAIALQGIRLANPTLGEAVAVFGLGLIGLMVVQLLRANGCRVLGIDFDPTKLELARSFGAEVVDLNSGEDSVAAAERFSRGRGMDAVIIAASTANSEPVHHAALMSRKRGRIVLVGVTGLDLLREDFFKKELTFQVSASYGPGRYDPAYEEKGQDYPVGFVRWTEQRNFEAVLDMMATRALNVRPLISHRFKIDDAALAYDVIAGATPSLGVLLEYPESPVTPAGDRVIALIHERAVQPASPETSARPVVSFIGAGNYATAVLIPAFKAAGAALGSVASNAGVTGLHAGRKFGFAETTTDNEQVFASDSTDAVVITTRHDSHAALVIRGLEAGKHVFVEKPLCLKLDEVDAIATAYSGLKAAPVLMVGFNRRFAPQVIKMRELLAAVPGPKTLIMTVNAGAIPADHWTQDRSIGGGRIVGEACHFIDLLRHLADAPIVAHHCVPMASSTGDTITISLQFADGTLGVINYLANGSKTFPKERLEVFASGRVLQLDNFRRLSGYGWSNFSKMKLWQQDKGQQGCASAFLASLETRISPIPMDEILEVARVSIQIAEYSF